VERKPLCLPAALRSGAGRGVAGPSFEAGPEGSIALPFGERTTLPGGAHAAPPPRLLRRRNHMQQCDPRLMSQIS